MTEHVTNLPAEEQLVPVFTDKIGDTVTQACDARALHTYLGVRKVFASWLECRITKYQFIENQDFILISQNGEIKTGRSGDRRNKDRTFAYLTLIVKILIHKCVSTCMLYAGINCQYYHIFRHYDDIVDQFFIYDDNSD